MIDRTNSERQKRYMARLKAKAADAAAVSNAEIEALKAELAQAKAHAAAVSNATIEALKTELAQAKARLTASSSRRELPPDEIRERQIKGLQTRIRNLTAELRMMRDERNAKAVVMFDSERTAIIKVLHPDREPTANQRSDALQRFNAWWDRQPKKRK